MILETFSRAPLAVRKLPYFVGLLLWRSCYWPVRRKAQFWAKNSYALGTLVPGRSDLDGVIFCSHHDHQAVLSHHLRIYPWAKKLIPFLGEITFLEAEEAALFAPIANFYELSRDPHLAQLLGQAPAADREQGLVFFLRMLEADAHNLRQEPFLRRRKWQRHLEDLGILDKIAIDLPTLTQVAHHHFFPRFASWAQAVENYLGQSVGLEELARPEFIFLFPHRALGAYLHLGRFEEMKKSLGESEFFCQKLFLAHLDWELWGLSHQRFWIQDSETLTPHLNFLRELLRSCRKIGQAELELREKLFTHFLLWASSNSGS